MMEVDTRVGTMDNAKEIVGAGGGKKGGGATADNTLRSKATARLVEAISEGPIVGLVNGSESIYFDDTPIKNADGTLNFDNVTWQHRLGHPDDTHLNGHSGIETILSVDTEVKKSTGAVTRTITNANADAVRVMIRVNSLFKLVGGNTQVSTLHYNIALRPFGGIWNDVVNQELNNEKTSSPIQIAHRIELPVGGAPWDIRVTRVTDDAADDKDQSSFTFQSMITLIEGRYTYPHTALIGMTVEAESLGQSLPERAYKVMGRIISVPSNYNPTTRVYTGAWNGTFVQKWTNNPAWIFYDLFINDRYALGEFISVAEVSSLKWQLYTIGRYCDQLIPSGFKDDAAVDILEPRFSFNGVIRNRQDAYHALRSVAAAFRGMGYWAVGQVFATADMPSDPTKMVTAANVINGRFNYSSSALKARHSVALVKWNDPNDFYRPATELVVNEEALRKFGWREKRMDMLGCTSRGLAHRYGKWALDVESTETETVEYKASFDHMDVVPGDIISIADPRKASVRMGGRVVNHTIQDASNDLVVLDAAVAFADGETYKIWMTKPDGSLKECDVVWISDDKIRVLISNEAVLSETNSVFIITGTDVVPRQYRILGITEAEENIFQITALFHDPDKYARIEQGIAFDPQSYTREAAARNVQNLAATEIAYVDDGVARAKTRLTWEAPNGTIVREYVVQMDSPTSVKEFVTSTKSTTVDIPNLERGTHTLYVTAIDRRGRAGPPSSVAHVVTATDTIAEGIVSNLILTDADGSNEFFGRDARVEWKNLFPAVSGEAPTVENSALYDFNTVKVFDNGTNTLLRTSVVRGDKYTYSFDHNQRDCAAAILPVNATRNLRFEISVTSKRAITSLEIPLTVSNPVPDAVVPDVTSNGEIISVGMPATADSDVRGMKVWIETNNTFDPALTTPKFEGAAGFMNWVGGSGVTYYARAGYYDFFDDTVSVSAAVEVITGSTIGIPDEPSVPTGLALTTELLSNGLARITATWAANTESDLLGYDLLVSEGGGNDTGFSTATPTMFWNLARGATLTVSVRATKPQGIKSNYSVTVSITAATDTVAPAVPVELVATGAFGSVWLTWTPNTEADFSHYELYRAGAATPAPIVNTIPNITTSSDVVSQTNLGDNETRYFWIRAVDTSGNKSAWSESVNTTTTSLQSADISGIVDQAAFAAGLEPINVVTALPNPSGYTGVSQVFLTTNGKTYRYVSGAWATGVAAADVTGQMISSQIANVAASKLTGTINEARIGALAASKISGQLTNSQLANIDATKLTGIIAEARIASLAASKVTGQLTDSQIADLSAAKLNGLITQTQITDNSISTSKLAANAITAAKLSAGAITTDKIAANAITVEKISAGAITTAKLAASSVQAVNIATDAITADKVAANAITAKHLAIGDFSNMVGNDWSEGNLEGWTIHGKQGFISDISIGDASGWKLTSNDRDQAQSAAIIVTPGETYFASVWVNNSATEDAQLMFHFDAADGSGDSWPVVASTPVKDQWVRLAGQVEVPSGATRITTLLQVSKAAGSGGQNTSWTKPVLRRAGDGELIVDGAITATKVAAGAITAAEIAANTILSGNIAAGAVTTAKLAVGGGGNLLDNSNWVAGMASIHQYGNDATINAETTLRIRPSSAGWSALGAGVLEMYQNGTTNTPAGAYVDAYFHSVGGAYNSVISVTPGDWYEASAQISSHRCSGALYLYWRNSSGDYISAHPVLLPEDVSAAPDAETWPRYSRIAQAPAGAASVQLMIRKYATVSGSTSYIFAHKPMLAKTHEYATNPSPYIPSGSTFISGAEILTGAIIAAHLDADSITANAIKAGEIKASHLDTDSVTAGAIQAGAIGADQLAANTVLAKHLAVGDFTNHAAGSTGDWTRHPWSLVTNLAEVYVGGGFNGASPSGVASLRIKSRSSGITSATLLNPIEVGGGDELFVEFWAYIDGSFNGSGNSKLRFSDQDNNFLTAWRVDELAPSTWTKISGTVTAGAGLSQINVHVFGDHTAGQFYLDDIVIRRKNGGELIVDGSIAANKIDTTDLVAKFADIETAYVKDANISGTLNASRITAGTALAASITVAGTALSQVEDRAANPATRVNSGSVKIDPGKITISGGTTLDDWRGADQTTIDGGAIQAQSIKTQTLEISARPITTSGIAFSADGNTLSWTAGQIQRTNNTGGSTGVSISAGSVNWIAGKFYIYWEYGNVALSSSTSHTASIGDDKVILCVYVGGNDFDAKIGQTIIDGDHIKTGAVEADHIKTGTITASEIAAGTLTTDLLQVGTGTNLVQASDWSNGLNSVQIGGLGGIWSQSSIRVRGAGESWAGTSYPTIELKQDGTATDGYTDFRLVLRTAVSTAPIYNYIGVEPGKYYEFTTKISTHRCSIYMYIGWKQADGTHISYSGAGWVDPGSDSSSNPDEWATQRTVGVAPAGAAFAYLFIRKGGTTSYSNSYVFFHKPQFAETHEHATVAIPYSTGSKTVINGQSITTGSITAAHANFSSLSALGLTAGNADIDNLAVDTLKIADNAVTVPAHASSTGNITANGSSFTNVISAWLARTSGVTTTVTLSARFTGSNVMGSVRIQRRVGTTYTTIETMPFTPAMAGTVVAFTVVDTDTASGSTGYYLSFSGDPDIYTGDVQVQYDRGFIGATQFKK